MVSEQPLVTVAEDFSFFAQRAPGLFIFLGSNRKGVNAATAPANHSPLFDVDEGVLPLGVRTLANLADRLSDAVIDIHRDLAVSRSLWLRAMPRRLTSSPEPK